MIFIADSWGVELYEFNPCHKQADGTFGTRADCGQAGALKTHISPEAVTSEFVKGWGGSGDKTYYRVEGMQLKGRPLTDDERAGGVLYHVTTDLEGVVTSGKLLALEAGGGLGGGQHPAVSFTSDRKAALNILDVMAVAKLIVHDAPFEQALMAWRSQELAAVAARLGGMDNVPMHMIEKSLGAVKDAVRNYTLNLQWQAERIAAQERTVPGSTASPDWQRSIRDERTNIAMDSFNNYLWGRDSAELGKNPVIFTRGVTLRDRVKTLGIVRIAAKHVPTTVLANLGADTFQGEIEVHGDVSIWEGYYTTRGELRRERRFRKR